MAAAIIRETAHPDVNMIFGAVIDPNMADQIRVTVIATGFERTGMPRRTLAMPRNEVKPTGIPSPSPRPTDASAYGGTVSVDAIAARPAASQEFRPQPLNTDDLESIPTFLRNRR